MSIASKMATLFRGDVPLGDLPREFVRRRRAARHRAAERREIGSINEAPARLRDEFRGLAPAALLDHFRSRPYSFFGFADAGPVDVFSR